MQPIKPQVLYTMHRQQSGFYRIKKHSQNLHTGVVKTQTVKKDLTHYEAEENLFRYEKDIKT